MKDRKPDSRDEAPRAKGGNVLCGAAGVRAADWRTPTTAILLAVSAGRPWKIALLLATVLVNPTSAAAGSTERVSVDSGGVQGNHHSCTPAISADSRHVAFQSDSDNLVAGDTNGWADVFVHDRYTGETVRVSVDSDGNQGNRASFMPVIDDSGRFTAFVSEADNLVPGDSSIHWDVFVYDRDTGTTERVSVNTAGAEAEDSSSEPSISSDGRFVAFESQSANLVPLDGNGKTDVFVHDRDYAVTERVSVSSTGAEADDRSSNPSISGDGRYVAFESEAGNLAGGDANPEDDIFVHDRVTGVTSMVSVSSTGVQGNAGSINPSISSDGRYVAFASLADNLVDGDDNGAWDIFVRDCLSGVTQRVSVDSGGGQSNHNSLDVSLSGDGRYVAFESDASNLVFGDGNGACDVFVHDRNTGVTERVSVDTEDDEGNLDSERPSISADGNFTAFESAAPNLVEGDTNTVLDVFVHDSEHAGGLIIADGFEGGSTSAWSSTVGW